MLGFDITAQELARWVPVIAIAGVLVETTISGIREEKKKQQAKRPQKNRSAQVNHSVSEPT